MLSKKYYINTNIDNYGIPIDNSDGRINERRKVSVWKGLKQIYFEYCANTSIHGVQYLGEQRPWKEKLFWLCVFLVSIYCCTKLIENIYAKWNETPVIVSFSEKSTPVWSIPFPAVTICSETKRVLKNEGMLSRNKLPKNCLKPQ